MIEEAQTTARALLSPQDAQDLRDGFALRRLREALPEGWVVFFEMESKGEGRVWGLGATIAEAADKCREALG